MTPGGVTCARLRLAHVTPPGVTSKNPTTLNTISSAGLIDLRKALVRKRTAKKMTLIVLKNDSQSCVNSKADKIVTKVRMFIWRNICVLYDPISHEMHVAQMFNMVIG